MTGERSFCTRPERPPRDQPPLTLLPVKDSRFLLRSLTLAAGTALASPVLMKPRNCVAVALLGALVLAACSNADMMNDGPSTMQSALGDARIENDRHSSACQGADSLPKVVAELDLHNSNMTAIVDRMHGAHGHMSHCSGGNWDGLSRSVTDMHTAMSDHEQRMRSAATIDAARSECSMHVAAMDEMMQGMMGDLTGMSCMMGG